MPNWGALTHAHRLVGTAIHWAPGGALPLVSVNAQGAAVRLPVTLQAGLRSRKKEKASLLQRTRALDLAVLAVVAVPAAAAAAPIQSPPPLPSRKRHLGSRPSRRGAKHAAVVNAERLRDSRLSGEPRTSGRINITNVGRWWVDMDAGGGDRNLVDAEIVCIAKQSFIAVFDTMSGVADAPLGIVCGPLVLLPKMVLEFVKRNTKDTATVVEKRQQRFGREFARGNFQAARYLGDEPNAVPTRHVHVACSGPLKGRTMTRTMVAVLSSRVRFADPKKASEESTERSVEFVVDYSAHPENHDFNTEPACVDQTRMFAFDVEGRPTERIGSIRCGSIVDWVKARLSDRTTEWLVEPQSVRSTRSTPATIALLHAPTAPSPKHNTWPGRLAALFLARVRAADVAAAVVAIAVATTTTATGATAAAAGDGWLGHQSDDAVNSAFAAAARAWPGTVTGAPAAFEMCAGQHGRLSSRNKATRCCCGLVNASNNDAFEPTGVDDCFVSHALFNRKYCNVKACGAAV